MKTHDISIIIPYFNVKELLVRCIDSIPDDNTIEIIIIDDASFTVNAVKITDFNKKLSRVVIVVNEMNMGAGYARNEGLRIASGRWVIFADSDDYFSANAFLKFKSYINSDYDVIYFSCFSADNESFLPGNRAYTISSFVEQYRKDNKLSVEALLYKASVPWAKMIRKRYIDFNDIKFDCVPAANDVMFSLVLGCMVKKYHVDCEQVYGVSERDGSLTKSPTLENIDSRISVVDRYNKYLVDNNKKHLIQSWASYLCSYRPYGALLLIKKTLFLFVKSELKLYLLKDIIKFTCIFMYRKYIANLK